MTSECAKVWTGFCRAAERIGLPLDMLNVLARVPIFEFRDDAVEIAQRNAKDPNVDHSYLVPFDEHACVDSKGVVLWYAIDRTGGIMPTADDRTVPRSYSFRAIAYQHPDTEGGVALWIPAHVMVGDSEVERDVPRTPWAYTVDRDWFRVIDCGHDLCHDLPAACAHLRTSPEQLLADIETTLLDDLQTALDELVYATQPYHYLVEETPPGSERPHWQRRANRIVDASTGQTSRRQLIPRYDRRPRIRYIRPEHVHVVRRDVTARDPLSNPKRKAHMRSGYVRILRAERYREKRGKAIYIRPHWVGDREWMQQRIRYRVIAG